MRKNQSFIFFIALVILLLAVAINLAITYTQLTTRQERINDAVREIVRQMPSQKEVTEVTKVVEMRGIDGINGANGKDGLNGRDGLPGKDGAKGDTGEKGQPGESIELKWINGILHQKYTNDDFWVEIPTEVTE